VRFRIVKSPFAFLCFLSGRTGGYFVWETLDGADATYIWRHAKPVGYLVSHKPEFKRWLTWVEGRIDFIHAAGRNEYLQEKHEGFTRVIHNYRDGDGFLKWKNEIKNCWMEQEHRVESAFCFHVRILNPK